MKGDVNAIVQEIVRGMSDETISKRVNADIELVKGVRGIFSSILGPVDLAIDPSDLEPSPVQTPWSSPSEGSMSTSNSFNADEESGVDEEDAEYEARLKKQEESDKFLETLKSGLKELFECGSFRVEPQVFTDYNGRYIEVNVYLDKERIYTSSKDYF